MVPVLAGCEEPEEEEALLSCSLFDEDEDELSPDDDEDEPDDDEDDDEESDEEELPLPLASAPVPHGIASPLGWSALEGVVVEPSLEAMVNRVVQVGFAPFLSVNW